MPTALGRLQSQGEIRRVPVDGRLDQQRYRYAPWSDNPLGDFKLSLDDCYLELAGRYFRWIGPATAAEFQWFSGLGVKAAKAVLDKLDLVPIAPGSDRLLPACDKAAFDALEIPGKPHYALVSSIDAITLHRRDIAGLTDPAHRAHPLLIAEGRGSGFVIDMPDHAIFDRGQFVGLWEFDPAEGKIVWVSFVPPTDGLLAEIAKTESYVRDQVGDARSFSLDSPKSRAPRLVLLRRAGSALEAPV